MYICIYVYVYVCMYIYIYVEPKLEGTFSPASGGRISSSDRNPTRRAPPGLWVEDFSGRAVFEGMAFGFVRVRLGFDTAAIPHAESRHCSTSVLNGWEHERAKAEPPSQCCDDQRLRLAMPTWKDCVSMSGSTFLLKVGGYSGLSPMSFQIWTCAHKFR